MDHTRLAAADRLRSALLGALAVPHEPALSTSELRQQAHDALGPYGSAVPVVIEAVYRALRTLQRRGLVEQQPVTGRHARWILTSDGAATARQLYDEPPERIQDGQ